MRLSRTVRSLINASATRAGTCRPDAPVWTGEHVRYVAQRALELQYEELTSIGAPCGHCEKRERKLARVEGAVVKMLDRLRRMENNEI